MNIESVGCITIICYLVGMIAKRVPVFKDDSIPALVGACGGVLGAVGMILIPSFPASDALNAIAVGIISGLASTGADQFIKNLRA